MDKTVCPNCKGAGGIPLFSSIVNCSVCGGKGEVLCGSIIMIGDQILDGVKSLFPQITLTDKQEDIIRTLGDIDEISPITPSPKRPNIILYDPNRRTFRARTKSKSDGQPE